MRFLFLYMVIAVNAGLFHHDKENTVTITATDQGTAATTATDASNMVDDNCDGDDGGSALISQLNGLRSNLRDVNQKVQSAGSADSSLLEMPSNLHQALDVSSLAKLSLDTHKLSFRCMDSKAKEEVGNLVDDLKIETMKMALSADNLVHIPGRDMDAIAGLLKKTASTLGGSLSLVSTNFNVDNEGQKPAVAGNAQSQTSKVVGVRPTTPKEPGTNFVEYPYQTLRYEPAIVYQAPEGARPY